MVEDDDDDEEKDWLMITLPLLLLISDLKELGDGEEDEEGKMEEGKEEETNLPSFS